MNRLRVLIWLSRDLRALDDGRYLFASEKLDEVGRMVGGWLKTATP